ncbi:hypothetical protein ACFLWL_03985, partial [Chloroflexota bacterium]
HVPGMDVAIGVTAYQLADITRMATLAAIQGRNTTTRVAKTVEKSLSQAWKPAEEVWTHTFEIARHASRGVAHAANETTADRQHLFRAATLGIMRALKRAGVDPTEAIQGSSYGAVQGAAETRADLAQAATQALASAKEAAESAGLSEEAAVGLAAEGALAAAEAIGPEALAKVKDALPSDLSETSLLKPNEAGDSKRENDTGS